MIKVENFSIPGDLRQWLDQARLSRERQIWLAHRAAMRSLPSYWSWAISDQHETFLAAAITLRCSLVCQVATMVPALQQIASCSDVIFNSTVGPHLRLDVSDSSAARSAGDAVQSAINVVYRQRDINDYVTSAAYSSASAASHSKSPWLALHQDCLALVNTSSVAIWNLPLWGEYSSEFDQEWQNLRDQLSASDTDWSFWITWYEHALAGTETRWDLLERIARSDLLDYSAAHSSEDYDTFWEGTDAEVNTRINAIWEDWKTNQQTIDPASDEDILDQIEARTYNAETVIFNEETGKWRVEPVTKLDGIYMREAVEEIEELVSRLTNQSGQLRNPLPLEIELSILTRSRRHIDAPRRLYRDCQTVLRRVQAKIKNGDCPAPEKDADMADMLGTLSDISFTLINRDPEVKKAVQLSENTPDIAPDSAEAKLLAQVAQVLEPQSEGVLAEDFREMSQAIVSQEIGSEERKVMAYILSSRIFRLFRVLRDAASATNDALKPFADLSKTAAVLAGAATSPWWASSFWQFILRYFG